MRKLIFPENYQSILDIVDTQKAIKQIKSTFEHHLSLALGLVRVSAPIIVDPNTGLNDNLSGIEKAISFNDINGKRLEVVQSLAKWKRYALKKYNLTGIYTDMNALRPCEELDNLHSLYVDQWDWEKVIANEGERNLLYLKDIVDKIYQSIILTSKEISKIYPALKLDLPAQVTYITSEELLKLYPHLDNKAREKAFCKKHHAVFIIGIGGKLSNGEKHDSRASDYDDWNLNGDLLIWDDIIDEPIELTSMGIRVNKDSLLKQLDISNENFKLDYEYHQSILSNTLPLTIGGGIGQSRLCMLLLKKAHIGEVQSSYWDENDIAEFAKKNIFLL